VAAVGVSAGSFVEVELGVEASEEEGEEELDSFVVETDNPTGAVAAALEVVEGPGVVADSFAGPSAGASVEAGEAEVPGAAIVVGSSAEESAGLEFAADSSAEALGELEVRFDSFAGAGPSAPAVPGNSVAASAAPGPSAAGSLRCRCTWPREFC
jgi:hypothetical protein